MFGITELVVILVVVIIIFFLIPFWGWMFVDAMNQEKPRSNTKAIWVCLIILTGPVGALIYFFVRRKGRISLRKPTRC